MEKEGGGRIFSPTPEWFHGKGGGSSCENPVPFVVKTSSNEEGEKTRGKRPEKVNEKKWNDKLLNMNQINLDDLSLALMNYECKLLNSTSVSLPKISMIKSKYHL